MSATDPFTIVLIEDDPIMGESLTQRLPMEGFAVQWLKTGDEALHGLSNLRPDVVLCDIRLPDMSGEELFRSAIGDIGSVPVVFMTAYGDLDQAVRLIRAGADDYITKPFDLSELISRLRSLIEQRPRLASSSTGALGRSPAMRRIEAVLRRVANIDSTVLLVGESGTGKEVAARFLRDISDRKDRPFVAVNCAAIPKELVDSEIFGHERGAFTGAHGRHVGHAERACNGVLLLDEVAELSESVQAKLLRLLQERVFTRVGGGEVLNFQARLICATNADLQSRIASGRFREDLFYRLNVISVTIPPLRKRAEEVLPLIYHYVDLFSKAFGRDIRGLSTLAEDAAHSHVWPGNVRELRNRVERAVALSDGPWIGAGDLFPEQGSDGPVVGRLAPLSQVRDAAERRHILAALEQTDGNVAKAAQLLDVPRSTMWERIHKLGIQVRGDD